MPDYGKKLSRGCAVLLRRGAALAIMFLLAAAAFAQQTSSNAITNSGLEVSANPRTGQYTVRQKAGPGTLTNGVAAKVNGRWLHSIDYPQHAISSPSNGVLSVVHSGLAGQPQLLCSLRLNDDPAYLEISVEVRNTTGKDVQVQGIRSIEIRDGHQLDLGGPEASDRILSDSFSEDRPAVAIHDLGDEASGLYRGVGSQLIYNRQSRNSLFVGALSSDLWLTVLRIHGQKTDISSYEVESTGTTELELENSLRSSPPQDRVELSLPLGAGKTMAAEKLMLALGPDYHAQLESYGKIIRNLHHARVTLPAPIGWWSWTAYYFGLNQGAALTNAKFLAERLKDFGYKFFHIDEGYQYARGQYTTANATNFPDGLKPLEAKVSHLGLTPGIWTAPFEVSERAWVYQHHKDWLIHNAQGQPIHAGYVIGEKKLDQLYMLDSTNPGAQNYLRQTYTTLARDWGIRYIKLDFMDDSAIEGRYFRPNTTAMEAQRIGLKVIREAVGDDVILDKDGSVMLNPVGIVDCGRISQDTGHTFQSSHDAATGVAARYYMNRNFFVSDPDAFTVSRQTVDEQEWHGGKRPLTLDEARISIALSAVSGGMYEIGDDLPDLFADADRMALVENRDLINMARLGLASMPLDLMSYAPEDEMPSIFILHESKRQSILTVFNWTDKERHHNLQFADLGLSSSGEMQISDVLGSGATAHQESGSLSLTLAPRSVQVWKIVDPSVPASAPSVSADVPANVKVGEPQSFSAKTEDNGDPALEYRWDFGDGTSGSGPSTRHTFTHPGSFTVRLSAAGIEGVPYEKTWQISASGKFDTRFDPKRIVPLGVPER
jgi:hypothetical protein